MGPGKWDVAGVAVPHAGGEKTHQTGEGLRARTLRVPSKPFGVALSFLTWLSHLGGTDQVGFIGPLPSQAAAQVTFTKGWVLKTVEELENRALDSRGPSDGVGRRKLGDV